MGTLFLFINDVIIILLIILIVIKNNKKDKILYGLAHLIANAKDIDFPNWQKEAHELLYKVYELNNKKYIEITGKHR